MTWEGEATASEAVVGAKSRVIRIGDYKVGKYVQGVSHKTTYHLSCTLWREAEYRAEYATLSSERLDKAEKLRCLEGLRELEEDWDGYGALPIEEAPYRNMKVLLEAAPAWRLYRWDLSPDVNGTLMLSTRDGSIGAINIGATTMTYIARRKGEEQSMAWRGPYSKERALRSLEEISKRLGYE